MIDGSDDDCGGAPGTAAPPEGSSACVVGFDSNAGAPNHVGLVVFSSVLRLRLITRISFLRSLVRSTLPCMSVMSFFFQMTPAPPNHLHDCHYSCLPALIGIIFFPALFIYFILIGVGKFSCKSSEMFAVENYRCLCFESLQRLVVTNTHFYENLEFWDLHF